MKVFLDTSSLIKLYHSETGTEALLEIFSKGIESIYLPEITSVEFLSAIWKKIRQKELSIDDGKFVISCFESDFNHFRWVELLPDVVKTASELIKKYGDDGLRTLDSIQLSSATRLREENCIFLTSDKLHRELFEKENLNTIIFD